MLRWITTAATARALYGSDWETKIIPTLETYFGSYAPGTDILSTADYSPAGAAASASTIDGDLNL